MLVGETEKNEEVFFYKLQNGKKNVNMSVTRSNPIDSLRLSQQVLWTGILTKK